MAYKSILVHLDQAERSAIRFDLALDLAKRQQASLNGYYATSMPYLVQQAGQHHKESRVACEEKADNAGVPFIWVEESKEMQQQTLTARLNYQSFFSDLTIIGQPGADAGSSGATPRDLPEKLILTSGHPVLCIPFAGNFKQVGKRTMIAWRSGRTSARALFDALPLLTQAETVHLLSFATNSAEAATNIITLKKLAGYLDQHGIKAATESRTIQGIGFGDALLNRVAEEGIDLLVAGGGLPSAPAPLASQVLKQMTVPVLMSS
ncbi:MAG: universal stress protein [Geopsychrobacter sp.]|nr:universal stress protein [Geopsychrobacter sp.]